MLLNSHTDHKLMFSQMKAALHCRLYITYGRVYMCKWSAIVTKIRDMRCPTLAISSCINARQTSFLSKRFGVIIVVINHYPSQDFLVGSIVVADLTMMIIMNILVTPNKKHHRKNKMLTNLIWSPFMYVFFSLNVS